MHEEISKISPLLPAHLQQRVEPFQNVSVIEKEGNNLIQFDLLSRLMKDRIVFIGEQVSDPLANYIIAQMLYLQMQDPNKDINIYIHAPGGVVSAGLAIYDTMQYIKPDITTICMGQATSMGALLLAAGEKGKRYALPHARVMIHQPLGGAQGQATDIEIQVKEILKIKETIHQILAKHTGQPMDRIRKDTERDYFMNGEEALEYGIVDKIISKRELQEEKES